MELFPAASQIEGRSMVAATGAVACGGAAGATARWAAASVVDQTPATWPWPTLIVNVVGCLLIGVAIRRLERGSLTWDAIVTGLLGGFTTMSAFAVELNEFADAGRASMGVAYAATTLAAGAIAVIVGGGVGDRLPLGHFPASKPNQELR